MDKPLAEQEEIARCCGCRIALVYRVSKQYEQEGIDRVCNRSRSYGHIYEIGVWPYAKICG
jgi:hypothetical protein